MTILAPTSPPKFITFEGTEGVGKTTAIDGLCAAFDKQGVAYVRTREPGGSELAERLRKILLNNKSDIHDDTELLLMFAARADHAHKVILPALADGKWVLCDRFIDSTVAYQGFGRYGGKPCKLAKIHYLIDNFVPCLPDITFWLDIDPVIGMERASKRSSADRFEAQELAFFERTHQGFCHQHKHCQRIHRINANATPQAIIDKIWQRICDMTTH